MTTTELRRSHTTLSNKVPQVTIYFWIIKVLCTTVGETAADYLNVNLNFGLTKTSIVTGVPLAVVLTAQIASRRYVPSIYWAAVAVISVFGTLVTDNLTDNLGVPLETSTLVFSALLALTFAAWYASEHSLSIHSIITRRREAFYWLTVLFTFALGTAAGDLLAEGLALGYLLTGFIVAGLIAAAALAWRLGLNPVLSFWIVYILTRPLWASVGDLLSQPTSHSGLGLGTTTTSVIFLLGIAVAVSYLTVTRADVIDNEDLPETEEQDLRGGLWHTVITVALVLLVNGTAYHFRKDALDASVATAPTVNGVVPTGPAARLGDLSTFRTITQDTLDRLKAGDQTGATKRIGDLEYEWDNAQARLKARDKSSWTEVDDKIDTVLRELRSTHPDPTKETAALTALLADL